MKIKNISKAHFNLKSGVLMPEKSGIATLEECQVLFSSRKAIQVEEVEEAKRVTLKKAPNKKKSIANG